MTPTTLLIDLDDTLFEERAYVRSGFNAAAQHMTTLWPTQDWGETAALADEMMEILDREGRGAVFDGLLETRGIVPAAGMIENLVSHYRAHQPDITSYKGVDAALRQLSEAYRMALVTNGNGEMQRRKVEALEIAPLFDAIIYCDEHAAPKPDPAGLLAALDRLGARPQTALMIGDNPSTDGKAAKAAAIPFLRVRTQRFAHLGAEVPEVTSFSQVPSVLAAGFSI